MIQPRGGISANPLSREDIGLIQVNTTMVIQHKVFDILILCLLSDGIKKNVFTGWKSTVEHSYVLEKNLKNVSGSGGFYLARSPLQSQKLISHQTSDGSRCRQKSLEPPLVLDYIFDSVCKKFKIFFFWIYIFFFTPSCLFSIISSRLFDWQGINKCYLFFLFFVTFWLL